MIDYYGTRWGQAPYCPRGFSRSRGDKLLTTSVLDLRRDMLPISQEDFLVHEATNYRLLRYLTCSGTYSPYPKRIFSSTRRQIIDYYSHRSLDGTSSQSPERIFLVHEMTNYSTTSVLNLRTGHAPYLPKGFLHP